VFRLEPAPAIGWIGYLTTAEHRRARLTLAEAWRDPTGVYLVLEAPPEDLERLVSEVAALESAAPVRCVWIAVPDARRGIRTVTSLRASLTGRGPALEWRVSHEATLSHGDYRFDIRSGATLTPGVSPTYGIAVDAHRVRFGVPDGDFEPVAGSVLMPFTGQAAGAWTASLVLSGRRDDFATLGVGLRYVAPSPPGREPHRLRVVPMPVFRQAGVKVEAQLAFDVLRPRDPERTHLMLETRRGVALLSGFTTSDGYDVRLAPTSIDGLPPSRLVFCAAPDGWPVETALDRPYLAPDGPFVLTTSGGRGAVQLGPSGVENVATDREGGTVILFRAGQPAYAPGVGPSLLTSVATTSHLTLLPASGQRGLIYLAQPPEAPLFRDTPGGILEHGEVPSGTLPTRDEAADCATLPVGAYRWLDPAVAADALAIERTALAPLRRDRIPPEPALAVALQETGALITPQGFVIEASASGRSQITIASVPAADPSALVLTDVRGPLAAALQADQAFLVVADPSVFFNFGSIRYQLREQQIDRLPVPPSVRAGLKAALGPTYPEFETEGDFAAVVEAVAGTSWDVARAAAGRLVADVQGWRFNLSPRAWRTDRATRTVMLIKFAAGPLASLVADPARWSWPAAAGDVSETRGLIEQILTGATAAPAGSDLAAFSTDVATNPAWNGVLVLNAPIVLDELPPDLRIVGAGTNHHAFYAHHVALALTAVGTEATGAPRGASAIGALVAYDDASDLVMTENVPFAFKAFSVRARFTNGAVAGFDAQVELMVNRLFGALLRKLAPERGNNLVLDGTYQVQQGLPVYQFVLRGVNEYVVARSALEAITVSAVRLETGTTAGEGAFDFVLSGTLDFRDLAGADVFSFEALRFSNLRVRMLPGASGPTFEVDEGGLALDATNSNARARSLAGRFPARVSRLIAIAADPAADPALPPRGPQALGYAPVLAPITTSPLEPPWYGLVFTVDLGSNGSLAGNAPLSLELLAAWTPGKDDQEPSVYLGASAGGAIGGGWSFQGVLRLGFKTFQLLVQDDVSGGAPTRDYGLRLGRFIFTALAASFPPGQADLFLFGNPDGDPATSLGWYAAYAGPPTQNGKAG